MTADEIRSLANQALKQTSAQHLRALFAMPKGDCWVILFSRGDEEWVIRVEERADSTRESLRDAIATEIQLLF